MNWIILMAGGDGQRMKAGTNKAFLQLLGKPISFYTLKTLEEMDLIDQIIIAARVVDKQEWQKMIKKSGFQKIVKLFPAAKTRQDSTRAILKWFQGQAAANDLIAVHNAVNPLVQPGEIKAVFKAAQRFGAALLAMPARDTVKISNQNAVVKETPLRQFAWYAQTPQVGRFDLMLQAFQKAKQDNFQGTDDSQLLERIGAKVKIVPCSPENFKITYSQDLFLAEKILKERRKK